MNLNVVQDYYRDLWDKELETMLNKEPRLKPMTLFGYLQDTYRAQISPGIANDLKTSPEVESII